LSTWWLVYVNKALGLITTEIFWNYRDGDGDYYNNDDEDDDDHNHDNDFKTLYIPSQLNRKCI